MAAFCSTIRTDWVFGLGVFRTVKLHPSSIRTVSAQGSAPCLLIRYYYVYVL